MYIRDLHCQRQQKSLQSHLRKKTTLHVRPDLAKKKAELIKQQNEFKVTCARKTFHGHNRLVHDSIQPQKLTWNLEMMVSNRNLLFQGAIFRFHVCFLGMYFLRTPTLVFGANY